MSIYLTNLKYTMMHWFDRDAISRSMYDLDLDNKSYSLDFIKIVTDQSYLQYDCTKCNNFTIADSNIVSCEFFPMLCYNDKSTINITIQNCNKIEKFNFKLVERVVLNRNFFIKNDYNITMKKFLNTVYI